jgi:hypothetical protein
MDVDTPDLMNEDPERDEELVRLLLPHWYATRRWAEELLCQSLGLKEASEVLQRENRGWNVIPGSNWHYRTHGVGVELDRGICCGGIDFDFPQAVPDPYRLCLFGQKQLNAGNLSPAYVRLLDDEHRFMRAATKVLDLVPSSEGDR